MITFLVIMLSVIVCYSKKLIVFLCSNCIKGLLFRMIELQKKKSSCFSHYHLIVCRKKMVCCYSHERPITSCNLVLASNKNPRPTRSGLPPYLLSFGWVKKPLALTRSFASLTKSLKWTTRTGFPLRYPCLLHFCPWPH